MNGHCIQEPKMCKSIGQTRLQTLWAGQRPNFEKKIAKMIRRLHPRNNQSRKKCNFHGSIVLRPRYWTKVIIGPAVADFYGTGIEIQAGFGPIGVRQSSNYFHDYAAFQTKSSFSLVPTEFLSRFLVCSKIKIFFFSNHCF